MKPWLFRTCHRRFWNSSNVQSLRWEKFILLFFKNNSRTREYLDFLQAFIEWVKFHINNTWLAIPVAMKGCTWALKRFMNTWNSSTFWFDAILRQRSSIEWFIQNILHPVSKEEDLLFTEVQKDTLVKNKGLKRRRWQSGVSESSESGHFDKNCALLCTTWTTVGGAASGCRFPGH